MTIEEVCRRFNLSKKELLDYKQDNLLVSNEQLEFSDDDLKCLSLILSLQEIGWSKDEIRLFIKTADKNSQLKLLTKQREYILEHLHQCQKGIDVIDYLIYQIKKCKGELYE